MSTCRNAPNRAFELMPRFMKRQYAPVEIVQTEMKGFGLRAGGPIPRYAFTPTRVVVADASCSGSLIYEYIGEVVAEKTFRKRMAQYAQEGIRHFYFMMLQKEEVSHSTHLSSRAWDDGAVHRCDEKGRNWSVCKSLVQPKFRGAEMGRWAAHTNGHIHQA